MEDGAEVEWLVTAGAGAAARLAPTRELGSDIKYTIPNYYNNYFVLSITTVPTT